MLVIPCLRKCLADGFVSRIPAGLRGGLKHLIGDAVRNRNFDKMLIGGHHQIGVDELFHERCGIVLRGVDVPASRIEAGAFGIIDRKGAVRVPDTIACQDRNSDCSVVKASFRLGTVRVIGGHHGAAVPRHHRYQYIHPRHVGADPSVYLGCLSWQPPAFSACGVCAIARQPVGIARLPVACRCRPCSRPARSRCALPAVSVACPSW